MQKGELDGNVVGGRSTVRMWLSKSADVDNQRDHIRDVFDSGRLHNNCAYNMDW